MANRKMKHIAGKITAAIFADAMCFLLLQKLTAVRTTVNAD